MKLLITADLHYNLKQFDWLLRQAAGIDAMVLAGDYLDIGSYVSPDIQSQVVENYFKKLRETVRVIASSGNHDADRQEAGAPFTAQWLQYLRDDGIEVDGDSLHLGEALVTVCPWWIHPAQRDRVAEQLRRDQNSRGNLWIWVHHVPPDESPLSWSGKRYYGEPMLNEWIEEMKPDLVFCGHIHHAPFYANGAWYERRGGTLAFNAGYEMSTVPPHFRVDLADRTVTWRSSEGTETCGF